MNLELKVIPPAQLLIAAGLMFALATRFPQYNLYITHHLVISIVFVIVGSVIGLLALYDFHKHQTTFHPHTPEKTRTVVDSGVFAYSRNPMYLALIITLLALAVYLQNYVCLIIIPLFIRYITKYQIIPEEEMLNKLFPNHYQAYCKKVRRWL
jgi:protein-S-isoprenylcysteine O-methyltransferase Ste14